MAPGTGGWMRGRSPGRQWGSYRGHFCKLLPGLLLGEAEGPTAASRERAAVGGGLNVRLPCPLQIQPTDLDSPTI